MFKFFPWPVFWRFFFLQAIVNSLVVLVGGVYFLLNHVVETESFVVWFLMMVLSLCCMAALISWKFSYPVSRLSQQVMNLVRKGPKTEIELDEEALFEESGFGFADLEVGLDRVRKKLKRRKERLLREREEAQAFLSSVPDALVSIGSHQEIIYFNSQFAAQFLSRQQLQANPLYLSEIFRQPEIHEGLRNIWKSREPQRFTIRLPTQVDTVPRFFSLSLKPLYRENELNPYGIIGIFHDVTDIKLADLVRIEFVANASHELRTPLTSVKGYVETLREDLKSGNLKQAQEFLDTVSRNVNRLIEIVNDLLSLSQLEHQAELKLEDFNPLSLSEEVIHDFEPIWRSKHQVIQVVGKVNEVHADYSKLEQVLRNLVANAIKYIPENKKIEIHWEQGPQNEILLRVKDNGPGIPEQHLGRLFERFYRVDKGRTRDAGGTGLGLAIVKHIMQSHGGRVQVKSKLGEGSEFICYFPSKPNGIFYSREV